MNNLSSRKFELLTDLGTLLVPYDYNLSEAQASFPKYSKPSRVLKGGVILSVQVFRQISSLVTTPEERMEFLRGTILIGIQGPDLVLNQIQDDLPKGFWYLFYDEKPNLRRGQGGRHKVPSLSFHTNGDFAKSDTYFDSPCLSHDVFMLFREIIT